MTDSLCCHFLYLGHRISQNLQLAWSNGLTYSEETITESILLHLTKHFPHIIRVVSISKPQEAQIGADWEWWFIANGPNPTKGLPLRVQAKRIQKNSPSFRALQTYTPKNSNSLQIDTLISHAKSNTPKMIPLHCLYVSHSHLINFPHYLSITRSNRFDLGCWLGLSTKIKSTQSNKLEDYKQIIFPWHLLVCPTTGSHIDLAHRVAEALRTYAPIDDFDDTIKYITPLPDYINRLLTEYPSVAEIKSILTERNIRGLVLFSDPARESP